MQSPAKAMHVQLPGLGLPGSLTGVEDENSNTSAICQTPAKAAKPCPSSKF